MNKKIQRARHRSNPFHSNPFQHTVHLTISSSGNDAGVLALEAAIGVGGVFGLGLLEAPLAAPGASATRYALWTTLPSFAPGVAASTLAQPPPPTPPPAGVAAAAAAEKEQARVLLRLRNVQAARQVLALATLLGVSLQATAAAARGRQRYGERMAEGREPPVGPVSALRLSHRPPPPSAAFHVTVAMAQEEAAPWAAAAPGASTVPQRWWTRPGWVGDPREWKPLVRGATGPVFVEADVSAHADAKGLLPLELALEGLRAGGRAAELSSSASSLSAVRVLLGGGEALKAGSAARRAVEESGSVDLLLDGEAAVAMAVLAWVEKTPYARAWAALAAQQARGGWWYWSKDGRVFLNCMVWHRAHEMRCMLAPLTEEEARLSTREGNPVWKGYERASELLEKALDAPYVGPPLHWAYRSLEGLGRRVRWLVKGGVTVRGLSWMDWCGPTSAFLLACLFAAPPSMA